MLTELMHRKKKRHARRKGGKRAARMRGLRKARCVQRERRKGKTLKAARRKCKVKGH